MRAVVCLAKPTRLSFSSMNHSPTESLRPPRTLRTFLPLPWAGPARTERAGVREVVAHKDPAVLPSCRPAVLRYLCVLLFRISDVIASFSAVSFEKMIVYRPCRICARQKKTRHRDKTRQNTTNRDMTTPQSVNFPLICVNLRLHSTVQKISI